MITLLVACILEASFGYPKFIYNKIKHPVVWIGAVISFLDKNCNRSEANPITGRLSGVCVLAFLLGITLAVSLIIQKFGNIYIDTICVASLLAFRSLYEHVNEVYKALRQNNLETARTELAKIVGRDTENLDESEIGKAAIESLSESFNDGVVAPVFWAALFGLAGIACYKTINTADSMIGHKTTRYRYFGWAAARLDDLANYIPARLSFLFIYLSSLVIASSRKLRSNPVFTSTPPSHLQGVGFPFSHPPQGGRQVGGSGGLTHRFCLLAIINEAKKHASPNSGYPQAAMANALGIALGGSRSYDGEQYMTPTIGENLRKKITVEDLQKALRIYLYSSASLYGFLFFLILIRIGTP